MSESSNIQHLLKGSQQAISGVLGPLPSAIIVLDVQMRVVLWSGGAKRLFGWREDEVLGKPNPLIPPDRISEYTSIVNRLLAGETVQGFDTVRQAKDGGLIDVSVATAAIRDEYGTLLGYVASITDVRARKKAERDMKQANEKISFLLENLPIIPYTRKAEGDFGALYIGPEVKNITGYTPEQFTTQSSFWPDHIHPEDRAKVFAEIPAMFARGSHAHEYRFQVADGSYLWFQDNVRLVRRADGSPDFLIGSWQDVTGRKLTEMALRANAERFRMLSQNSPLCVHEIDMGGKLQSMNPAGLAMMGLGREDIGKIIGLEYLSAVCADDTPRVEGLLQKAMSGEAGFFEFKSAGDAPRLFKSRLIPINDGSGAVIKLMGITEDVTEPRRMEEALRAAKDEAEKATLLKEKFVELVAHNLKSPFTSMLGQMKLLAAEKQTMDAAKKEEILRSAINGGEMMLRMIEELLDVTRLQTGQINPKLSFANLYSLTTGAAQTLGRLAEAKGILIVNKIPHKTRIWADPVLLTQVIHNLLANAITFTPRGGAVTIIAMDGDTMRIVVRDTGVGIPPGTGAKLFSKEKPISTPGTEGETGAGLGLPLAMEIMKAHGGNLLVEPATGKGSVFCAELPIKRPTLLVVDDIPVERLLVRDRLKGTDVEILEASNGREALATLEKREIHLVICDVKMPIMDGLEFLAEVRNNPKLAKLPVILFTSGGKDVFDKALALGADDFVTKPVNQEELAARVRRFVA